MRRWVAGLLVLVLVAVVVGLAVGQALRDGSPDSDPPPDPPTSEAAPDEGSERPPARSLERFYGQRIDWSGCGDNDCAKLRVPLDYDRPGGRTVEIALLRVPARGERIGSLVVNPGGPGAPGTSYAAAAAQVFREPLLRAYDVVGFDPRGTGSSAPIDCLSDTQVDAYLSADPSPDDASEVDRYVGLLETFGRGCAAQDPQLAAHVSTIEAARDMDVLRSALGDARLDYFGASYGTKLGATYAELFPDRVGRFVLDGAIDPSLTTRGLNLGQAQGFETALRAYVDNCVETVDSCFLGDSVAEGLGRISDFLAEVDGAPLPTSGERELAVGNAFYGIVAPLYVRDYWPILSTALRAGFEGDGTALLELADLYSSRGPDGYTDNSVEAFVAINCLDDPSAVPPREVFAEVPEFREVSPTFGDVFAWGLATCLGQEAKSTEDPLRIDGAGAPPIVVVGTTRDPATPFEWSVALAKQLESAVLVRRDGDGHTGYNSANECVDTAVEAYLIKGTVPDDGLSC